MGIEKIIAVIVLYKSTLEESPTFQTLLAAIRGGGAKLLLVVYNNSPDYWQYNQKQYDDLEVVYVSDSTNSGVSKAYNTAYQYAKDKNKEYILLLDQDTKLPVAFFREFLKSREKYKSSDAGLFCPMIANTSGLLSPAMFFLFTSKKLEEIKPGIHKLKGLAIINSGLIISIQLFELTGGYNEKIKLDFSDFDFLKRSLKFSKNIIVLDTQCEHELSSEGEVLLQSALGRFDYYLIGAKYYHKSGLEAIGLGIWIFLRGLKLDLKYKTINFTKRAIQSLLNKA